MALVRTPIEIWQTILRYSISVPVFFEVDPIETCGFQELINRYNDDKVYWRAERHRNILRRVCSAWDGYLSEFEYRYVRLEDVERDHIPQTAIYKAVRLQFGFFDPAFRSYYSVVRPMVENILQSGPEHWSLEILDIETTELKELILRSGKVPNVACLANGRGIDLQASGHLTQNISFIDEITRPISFSNTKPLIQLTTVRIILSSIEVFCECDLPALKHLSFALPDYAELDARQFIQLIRRFGKNLISLFDQSDLSTSFFPHEAWSLCPNLKRICSSFQWSPDSQIPSYIHGLHLPAELSYSFWPYDATRIPAAALYKAGTKMVAINQEWSNALGSGSVIDYVVHCMDHGVSLYDVRGLKFQDTIVEMISHRKMARRKPLRNWACGFFVF